MDINQLIKEAMLAKDSVRLSSLRAIKSAFLLAKPKRVQAILMILLSIKSYKNKSSREKMQLPFIWNKIERI